MIGCLTQLTIDASCLALAYEQLTWPQSPEEFLKVRQEAQGFIDSMDLKLQLSKDQDTFLAERSEYSKAIRQHLVEARGRILGDTVALPFFYIASMAYRASVTAPFGLDWSGERQILQECLEDLGIQAEFVEYLDRELGFVFVQWGEEGEPSISYSDAIRAGGSFFQRVTEEWAKNEKSLKDAKEMLDSLASVDVRLAKVDARLGKVVVSLAEFHDDYKAHSEVLEKLIADENKAVLDLIGQVQNQLIAAGIGKEEAEAVTQGDPEGLWDRLMRWAGKAPWADATEEALWAALDFVPAGTAVKLGIKVTEAVRKALKGK